MKWILTIAKLLEAVIMMVLPYLWPRPIYFDVRTGFEFRNSEQGRRILTQYWVQVVACTR